MVNISTSILKLLSNISEYGNNDLSKIHLINNTDDSKNNRANQMGELLEYFIKDAFCNSFKILSKVEKNKIFSEHFSFLGSQTNPPDMILKNSDAIEVKKISGLEYKELALNSSYPKSKLYKSDKKISKACRECESWNSKDIFYIIGNVEKNKLRILTIISGDCYAADKKIYERISKSVSEGLESLDLEFSKTKELGRVNRVDPLGITKLRIRGMWAIQNPLKLYDEYINVDLENELTIVTIMKKEKYDSFSKEEKENINKLKNTVMGDIEIRDPDNPAKLIDAVLITVVIN